MSHARYYLHITKLVKYIFYVTCWDEKYHMRYIMREVLRTILEPASVFGGLMRLV